jgi:hypothetical protein
MTLVGLLATFWKVGIAASLYRVFTIYQKYINKRRRNLFQPIYLLCKTMARLWLEATWFLVFGCFVDFIGLSGRSLVGVSLLIFIAGGLFFQRGLESRN